MTTRHATVLLDAEGDFYQALCICGWMSRTSFLEEVDLIRAIHAHDVVVFPDSRRKEQP
jgi:hypothetical protein